MTLEFSTQIFGGKKISHIKFQENPLSGCWVVPCGRKDRRARETNRDGETWQN